MATRAKPKPAEAGNSSEPQRGRRYATSSTSRSDTPISRVRIRTRNKLIAAAREVMARRGVARATIAEITEAADVGIGSFYNHFESKEELALAVFSTLTDEIAHILDDITDTTPDIALAVVFVHRTLIAWARRDPVWGWFMVHGDYALRQMHAAFHSRAINGIAIGVRAKRFDVGDPYVVATVITAGMAGIVRMELEGRGSSDLAFDFAETVLKILGLPPDEARALARHPMPDYLGA